MKWIANKFIKVNEARNATFRWYHFEHLFSLAYLLLLLNPFLLMPPFNTPWNFQKNFKLILTWIVFHEIRKNPTLIFGPPSPLVRTSTLLRCLPQSIWCVRIFFFFANHLLHHRLTHNAFKSISKKVTYIKPIEKQ